MHEKFSRLSKMVNSLEKRFTPSAEIYGSSEIYHDYDDKSSFRPNDGQLQNCVNEYARLIEYAASLTQTRTDSDIAADYLLNSSELVLGYFERCNPKAILTCKQSAQMIADSAKYLLVRAKDIDLDQSHRLIAIGQWLAEHAGVEFIYSREDSEPENGHYED